MSLDEELAQNLHEEEQARFNAEQEAEFDAEIGEASGSGDEQSAEKEKELPEEELQTFTTKPTNDKEMELWVKLKRLFEPDDGDTLWKLQRKRLSIVKSTYDVDVGCQAITRTIFRDGK
ncbi:hypothetical protein Tco_0727135 [Tanacetum coccineum]|uniref:Uncharacterized protein n=1 Tax=Tanacetum coccineum TaxID=301880 RepID=A0ABQ4YHK1_9ASTR